MNNPQVAQLEPKEVFHYFDAITAVPRPSKREEKAVKWLKETIESLGYTPVVDEVGNIVVRKPGSKGHENAPMVLLQGHVDMVCEKNRDTVHDFDKDPIPTVVDGDWIRTKGTTLGADNGIGVALALALLQSKELVHPPLEMLFTIDEETGMTGAMALKGHELLARRMINLDSEEEGIVYVGCAGGGDTVGTLNLSLDPMPEGMSLHQLTIGGLYGGHSGTDIQKGRGNAIQILGQTLRALIKNIAGVEICTLSGGSKRNAIAREAEAIIALPNGSEDVALQVIESIQQEVIHALAPVEPKLVISLNKTLLDNARIMDSAQVATILDVILAMPHGVLRMSQDIDGLVETSTNLATMVMSDNVLTIGTSQRSLVESAKMEAIQKVQATLRLGGFNVKSGDGYPGWKPNMQSELLASFVKTYEELFQKKPAVLAIHAGLECGLIGEKFPGMDMISVGPTLLDPHSPAEAMSIPDLQKFWKTLVKLMEHLA